MQTPTDEMQNDVIDLRELIKTLHKHKKVIVSIALITLLVAIMYAFRIQPVYKATAVFLPPSEADLSHISVPQVYQPDQGALYKRFSILLESRQVYWKVFDELNLLKDVKKDSSKTINKPAVFNGLVRKISLERTELDRTIKNRKWLDKITPSRFLSVKNSNPEKAAEIANKVAETANFMLAKQVIKTIDGRIALKKIQLEKEIRLLRSTVEKNKQDKIKVMQENDQLEAKVIEDQIAELRVLARKKRLDEVEQLRKADALAAQEIREKIDVIRAFADSERQDHIKVLEEAANIAKMAGIIERSGILSNSQFDQNKTTFYTEVTTQKTPLYFRGERAIKAEIEGLKNRKSNDPFTPELRKLQQELKLLETNNKISQLLARKNDDPFIPELRELEKKLTLLKNNRQIETLLSRENNDPFIESLWEKQLQLSELNSIKLDPKKVRFAFFDQPAFPPVRSINSQRRKRTIAIGAALGLFLGITVALMINFWQGTKEEELESANV